MQRKWMFEWEKKKYEPEISFFLFLYFFLAYTHVIYVCLVCVLIENIKFELTISIKFNRNQFNDRVKTQFRFHLLIIYYTIDIYANITHVFCINFNFVKSINANKRNALSFGPQRHKKRPLCSLFDTHSHAHSTILKSDFINFMTASFRSTFCFVLNFHFHSISISRWQSVITLMFSTLRFRVG